ncbi:MAG: 2TM domain-containing protein [Methanolinea sp.]|jgi:phosphotransferase system  glucose/maltose/N-acetylglucosamine-specific IIC component|nr:2TM domain-containing protein [Methanolinea sp.]
MTDESRERAKKRLDEVKGFYSHLSIFLIINVILILINVLTSPGQWWFYWVTIFWGIGLIFHASQVFGKGKILSSEWEEKKIQQYMEEEAKKK